MDKKKGILSIRNLQIIFPEKTLFTGINLEVYEHDLIVITTHVMDGATTFLKSIVGLVEETQGEVFFEKSDLLKKSNHQKLMAARKKMGLVYEANGLISIMNVYQNIALPLSYHTSLSQREISKRIAVVAKDLEITDILYLEPNELNDTQTRIINLARALVMKPRILLIDELEGGMSLDVINHMLSVIQAYKAQYHCGVIMTTLENKVSYATTHYKIKDHQLAEVNNHVQ